MATTLTDLTSHHIEGYARAAIESGQDGYFSVPLISHIEGNLWMGGCIDGVRLADDYAHVVSLYPWERYTLGSATRREEIRLYDSAEVPPADQLVAIARRVNVYRQAGKTLVHCQAGLNRSGLITGLTLVLDGMPPATAIALLRERRCDAVLCNAAFEAWLLDFDGAV